MGFEDDFDTLKSNMDRFIVLAVVMMLTLLFALKSNMDRFIVPLSNSLNCK